MMHSLLFLLFISLGSTRITARLVQQQNEDTRELVNIPYSNRSACEVIRPGDLPDECACREPSPLHVVIECLKIFNSASFNDTIGMKIDIDPCDPNGSSMSLDITEKEHNISYPISGIRAGEEKNFPIPGLSIAIPSVADVGLDAAVLISGNVDNLTLKVGLNACAGVGAHTICASSIPGLDRILPWWVLSGVYSFGDLCNNDDYDDAVKMENSVTALE